MVKKLNSGELKGEPGEDGENGITPTIGDNGNWYLDTLDTGKPSRGEKGDQGEKGEKGDAGMSYEEGQWTPRLFNTTSNEIRTSIAAAMGNYYRVGNIVFVEAMILTTSSYACHHISGLPYEPNHNRPSQGYPIGVVSGSSGTNAPFNEISGSSSYYVKNGAYASGKTYDSWYVYGWYRKA